MATYFHGNTGNGDALQTLILMNPAYNGYSDNLPPSSSSSSAHEIQHLAGIPLHQDARFLYNMSTPSKQGLSLSLSSQQTEEVRVLGAPDKAALSCKYLKVAQQLLDEVVNISKESDNGQPKSTAEPPPGDGRAKCGADQLTAAEKQEIQIKKAKLVDMLHQVEQRYKQYDEQMQIVIRWLEEAAGVGSAKTYTSLALQTISKQFRCLKDAIMAQIRGATTNLGEINNQQQQHHFQINNNNAWRPQRGLPERSVSVLRAWLFQHFLHPYPKDSDKVMLAKQAGLTRSQVSNWFINARVRLWKPMVEEMYAEEMKAQQRNDGSEEDKTPKIEVIQNTSSTSAAAKNIESSSEIDTRAKKPRNADASLSMSNVEIPMYESRQGFSITGAPANFFGSYDPIVGIQHFQQPYSSNGVSLTLGLQHCENLSNQMEAAAQGTDFGGFNAITHTSAMYDHNIDVQNNKRFAAQLLPDFVT